MPDPHRGDSPKRRLGPIRLTLMALTVVLVAWLAQATQGCASFGASPAGDRLERIQRSPIYHDGEFHNTMSTDLITKGSWWDMVRQQVIVKEERVPLTPIPVVPLSKQQIESPPASGLRFTWIGHASSLIEIDGYRVLTDPIWSDRCSPVSGVGPERFHPPPIPLDQLPPIDAVVISHDHYDHLDMATVRFLAARGTRFFVPLGIGAHLEKWEVPNGQIVELEWNQSEVHRDLTFTATMARHYSGRGMLNRNETLWASWVIATPTHRVYFSGDTGTFEGFQEIGARLGPFDLTVIKIGAYAPEWADIHMNPEEAVLAHQALRGAVMVPVHWGTFNLAYHSWYEPADRVAAAAEKAGIRLVVPRPGQQIEPASPPPIERWWHTENRSG